MHRKLARLVWPLLLAAMAQPVTAQNPSVLTLIDPGVRQIGVGESFQGTLGDGDWSAPDGNLLQAWRMAVVAGAEVTVDLISDDFDAYLFLVGPGIDGVERDDDGAGGCHSRITHQSATGGEYTVVVSSVGSLGRGAFTLQASTEPAPPSPDGCNPPTDFDGGGYSQLDADALFELVPVGRVTVGEAREGELTESAMNGDRPVQGWDFAAEGGQSVTFDMTSQEFDTYLFLAGPGLTVRSDDDSGGACNARLTITFPESATYRIGASSYGSATGVYRLTASGTAGPVDDGPCPGSGVGGDFMRDPEALIALPTEGRALRVGGDFGGRLSRDEDASFDDAPVQAWSLQAEAGVQFSVDLVSDDFDALLYLVGPGITDFLENDDGAGACHSRITHTPTESGVFRVIVSSIVADEGEFTIVVRDAPGPASSEMCGGGFTADALDEILPDLETAGRVVRVGELLTGALSSADQVEGRVLQAWSFVAEVGETYTIDLESDLFDTYLYVRGPGIGTALRDDDSGDSTNSQLVFTVEESGEFQVIVSAWGSGGEGAYSLFVERN